MTKLDKARKFKMKQAFIRTALHSMHNAKDQAQDGKRIEVSMFDFSKVDLDEFESIRHTLSLIKQSVQSNHEQAQITSVKHTQSKPDKQKPIMKLDLNPVFF